MKDKRGRQVTSDWTSLRAGITAHLRHNDYDLLDIRIKPDDPDVSEVQIEDERTGQVYWQPIRVREMACAIANAKYDGRLSYYADEPLSVEDVLQGVLQEPRQPQLL